MSDKKLELTLAQDHDLSIWINVNGESVSSYLPVDKRIAIYKKHLRIPKGIMPIILNNESNPFEYLWLLSAKNLRTDGLVDSIRPKKGWIY